MDLEEFYRTVHWDYHVVCLSLEPKEAEKLIRENGQLGWELVAVVNQPAGKTSTSPIVAYFKKVEGYAQA